MVSAEAGWFIYAVIITGYDSGPNHLISPYTQFYGICILASTYPSSSLNFNHSPTC